MVYISKIRVRNFKSLEDVTVEIKPLTLLIGKNSSGKSSFIKALLFLQKNLFPLKYKDLIFDLSDEVNLESYEETVFNHDVSRDIKFEITLSGEYLFFSDWLIGYDENNLLFLEKYFNKIKRKENIHSCKMSLNELFYYFIKNNVIANIGAFGETPFVNLYKSLVMFYQYNSNISYTYSYSGNNTAYLKKIKIEDKIFKTKIEYFFDINTIEKTIKGDSVYEDDYNYVGYQVSMSDEMNLLNPFFKHKRCNYADRDNLFSNIPCHLISISELLNDDINFKRLQYPDSTNKFNNKFEDFFKPVLRYLEGDTYKYYSYNGYIKEKYKNEYNLNLNNAELLKLYFKANKLAYSDNKIIPKTLELFLHNKHLSPVRKTPKLKYFLNDKNNFDKNIYYSFPDKIYSDYQFIKNEIMQIKNDKNALEKVINISFDSLKSKLITHFTKNKSYDNIYISRDFLLFYKINERLNKFGYNLFFYVEKNDKKDVGYLYTVNSKGNKFNLKNESSGLIQLLPIILILTSNEPNNYIEEIEKKYESPMEDFVFLKDGINDFNYFMTLIEQPELHLHPKAQSELANLFVDNLKEMNFNKRYIIETHSEHLVNRLQVLISKNLISTKDISIQYFDNSGEKIKIKTLKIYQNGLLKDNWPEGFIDQSYNNSVDLLFGSN